VSYLDRARAVLASLDAQGLRRAVPGASDAYIDFASNDYLGLSRARAVRDALAGARVVGSGGSRLLSGAHPEHTALEAALARFVKRERALLFSSGYLAAMGAVHGVAQLVESAYSDAHNHASTIDALRLTRLRRFVFAHGEPPHVPRDAPAAIISESVFGMSGAPANMRALLDVLGDEDILVLDEAHALGITGPGGAGLGSAYDDPRIVIVGTLSKALGASGGFVAGPSAFIDLLVSTARSFIFDTSMPPAIARAAHAALDAALDGDALRRTLAERVAYAHAGLREVAGITPAHDGPIIPVILGETATALEVARGLRDRGIFVPAIRPPTVAAGSARLRIVIRADHTFAQIDALTSALREALPRSGKT
jgi:8-amino-7-oxononanoate synthase